MVKGMAASTPAGTGSSRTTLYEFSVRRSHPLSYRSKRVSDASYTLRLSPQTSAAIHKPRFAPTTIFKVLMPASGLDALLSFNEQLNGSFWSESDGQLLLTRELVYH